MLTSLLCRQDLLPSILSLTRIGNRCLERATTTWPAAWYTVLLGLWQLNDFLSPVVASGQCLTATDRFTVIFFNHFLILQGLRFPMSYPCILLGEAGQATERMSVWKSTCMCLPGAGQKGGETALSTIWNFVNQAEETYQDCISVSN